MKDPRGNGNEIAARIRIDTSQAKRDGQEIARIMRETDRAITSAAAKEARAQAAARQRDQAAQIREIQSLARFKIQSAQTTARAEAQAEAQKFRVVMDSLRAEQREKQRLARIEVRQQELSAREIIRIEQQRAKEIARARAQQFKQDGRNDTMLRQFALAPIKAPSTTPFKEFSKAVGEARLSLIAFSGAATGLLYFGVRAADEINILTTRFRELTGSEREAERLMEQIAVTARRMNVPIRQAQKDFLGLVPAVRDAGGNLDQYMNIALRLATLNTDSRGGLEGAIYSIREALSSGGSDLVSLSERFNIPRRVLRDLIKETGNFADALDIVLDRYGATTEAAIAQSQSVGTLAAQIRDSLVQVLERTFAPVLLLVRDALKAINEIVKNLPQPIVNLAAGFVLATGAVSALTLATDVLGSGFGNVLRVAQTFRKFLTAQLIPSLVQSATAMKANNFGNLSTLGKVGVTGAALGVGIAGGLGATNLIGRATGDERLANYGLEDLITTIKQIIGIIGAGFLEVVRAITKAVANFVTSIILLQSGVDEFVLRLKVAILDIGIAINQMLGNMEEVNRLSTERGLPIIGTEMRGADPALGLEGLPFQVITGYTGLIGELMALEERRATAYRDTGEAVDKTFDNLRRGFNELLFPVEKLEEVTVEALNLLEMIATDVQNKVYAAREAEGKRLAESFDSTIAFMTEMADLIETGDTDMVESRIKALEDERAAIEQMIPTLEAYADDSQEAADKLEEARGRLLEINQTIPQFVDALTAATQRALAEAADKYREEVEKAEAEKQEALLKIGLDTADAMRKLRDEVADKEADLRDKALKIQDDYNKAILKAEEDLRKKLLEIQRNFMAAAKLAASQLDAAGVAAAINKRNEEIRKAQEDFAGDTSGARNRADEQRAELNKELLDLRAYYAERRAEIFRQNVEETTAALAAYDQAVAIAETARNAEREALITHYNQRLLDLQAAADLERQIRNAAMGQMIQDTANAWMNMLNIGQQIFGRFGMTNGTGDFLGSALTAGIGATLQASPLLSGIGQVLFNISGVTDPETVARMVNEKLIQLAGGA